MPETIDISGAWVNAIKRVLDDQNFTTFGDWVTRASRLLTAHPDYHEVNFRAVCFDTNGRLCRIGRDFQRARDEGTFPIHWVWPDQISEIMKEFVDVRR